MTCLQIYQKLLSLATFLGVHSNSEELSCLSLQNTYLNWKITCHINLNFLLWTKLLENLLFAKYLISVAVPLWKKSYHYQIYHCLRVKTSLYQKLFQTEKNKLLLWIYAQRLSGHLWSNGQWKSRVTSPN